MRFLTILILAATAALLCCHAARADFEVGQAALERGDFASAREAWRTSADEGDPRSQLGLGRLLLHEADLEGLELIERSAKAGNMTAELRMAVFVENGLYVPADLKALYVWLRRIEAHPVDGPGEDSHARNVAYFHLSRFHRHGIIAQKSIQQSAAYLRKAADGGDPRGQFFYAESLEQGKGVPRDLVEAYKFYLLCHKQDVMPDALQRAKAVRKRLSPDQLEDVKARLRTWLTAWKEGVLGHDYRRWKDLPEGVKTLERMENIHLSALSDARSVAGALDERCLDYWLRSRKRTQHDAQREITIEEWVLACKRNQRTFRVTFRPWGVTKGEKEIEWIVETTIPIGRP